jgi:hypothetical protein
MSIVLVGSTSGSCTLQEQAVAGTTVLTLPTTSGTVATLTTPSFATTIGVGGATPSTSGAGITFPATQSVSSDANTLDDYEEGTWTPTIVGSTTAGTASYSTAQGYYTKIGNRVFLQCYINWSSGTGTGNLMIGNLPFTTSSSANSQGGLTIGYINNVTLTASNYAFVLLQVNKTTVDIYQYPVGGGVTNPVAYDAGGELVISGQYFV